MPSDLQSERGAITVATDADVAAIVALVNGAYRGDSSRRGWTTEADLLGGQRTDPAGVAALIASPGHTILLLWDRSGLAACVLLEEKTGGTCYLGMLTVRPELQGGGIGRRLLAAAETHARERLGATAMEMTVIDVRHELIAWYERRGNARTGETRPFPYGDARFGLPRRDDLRFTVLRRELAEA
jgi:ribosomal protein S18 acetylase RimI-like enzyme